MIILAAVDLLKAKTKTLFMKLSEMAVETGGMYKVNLKKKSFSSGLFIFVCKYSTVWLKARDFPSFLNCQTYRSLVSEHSKSLKIMLFNLKIITKNDKLPLKVIHCHSLRLYKQHND